MSSKDMTIDNCVCGGRGCLKVLDTGFSVRCERDPEAASAQVFPTPKRAIGAWNADQKNMDQLTVDAVCAYHSGKHYGDYIAMKRQEPPAVRFPKQAQKGDGVTCAQCGMLIPANCRSRKYCSAECAEEARRIQRQVGSKKQEAQEAPLEPPAKPERTCIRCGKPIPAYASKRKYCSADCADQAREDLRRDYRLQRQAERKQQQISR